MSSKRLKHSNFVLLGDQASLEPEKAKGGGKDIDEYSMAVVSPSMLVGAFSPHSEPGDSYLTHSWYHQCRGLALDLHPAPKFWKVKKARGGLCSFQLSVSTPGPAGIK